MIRLTALLALCLVVSTARADDLDVIVDKNSSAESRGQAYYRLASADFPSIAAKLTRLIGNNSVNAFYPSSEPTTREPWKEIQLAEHDRIGCTLRQLWSQHFETKRPRGEDVELLLGLLEDPSVGHGRYMVAVQLNSRLHFGSLHADSSMPRMEDILRRLDRLIQDPKEREGVERYLFEMLFEHGDQNKYLDLAIRLSSTADNPMTQAEQFRNATERCRAGRMSEENRRKFLCHSYRLLEEIDDGHSGTGYFLALQLGEFMGLPPNQTGRSPFMPDSRLPEYQGLNLPKAFFQDTVNNARKWWTENKVACDFEEASVPRPSP